MKKIGLFGGTFDPVHLGHTRGAQEAAEALGLTRVVFIPSARPPHKAGADVAAFEHRLRMLELATGENPLFEVSPIEAHRPGPSYTVITLRELSRNLGPEVSLFFIIGSEAFSEIGTWKEPKALFGLASFAVMLRPSWPAERLAEVVRSEVSPDFALSQDKTSLVHPDLKPVHFIEITQIEVSGTLVRERVKREKSIKYLVANEVEGYILDNGLYR